MAGMNRNLMNPETGTTMNRNSAIDEIRSAGRDWDILIVGGGATGIGTALDAASRGYRTLLLEQHDFGKGTSSRSTKLVHGGVRYLRQGDVSLVFEALKERGLMMQNAPHLVRNLSFIIPAYDWWEGPFYTVGMKVYDIMAGKMGFGASYPVSREETIEALPNIEKKGLKGGIIYHDGQFDDARMLISMAQTADNQGARLVNYMRVTGLTREKGLISGVEAVDQETGEEMRIRSRVVINAAGVFADDIMLMDEPERKPMIRPSQGVHLVLDKEFLAGSHAIMVPQTSDGRVMFAVPWHKRVVVGTTDTLIEQASLEPEPGEEEVDFILETAGKYLVRKPERSDVLSVFAGLRPLAAPERDGKSTKEISRHHKILVSVAGLISIIGGKWTTYRKMAEDAMNYAIMVGQLEEKPCVTRGLKIHGYTASGDEEYSPLNVYGSDRNRLESLVGPLKDSVLSEPLGIIQQQVIWAVREEMARTVEDVLARRTRALFLDARESLRIAGQTAHLMAGEIGRDMDWVQLQVENYEHLVKNYLI